MIKKSADKEDLKMPLMHEITRPEFEKSDDKVVILPVGSTEQHGPHLPLGTDSYIAEGVALKLAGKTGAIVAPTLTYGYKSKPLSGGGPLFRGTIDLEGDTLVRLATDILCEFARDGFNKVFIYNAHFENQAFLEEAMDKATRLYPKLKAVYSTWWDVLDDETVKQVFEGSPFPGWALEHAAVTETSLIMYLKPELVRADLMPKNVKARALPYSVYPPRAEMVPQCGALAASEGSTAAKGKLMVDKAIEGFIEIFREEFGG